MLEYAYIRQGGMGGGRGVMNGTLLNPSTKHPPTPPPPPLNTNHAELENYRDVEIVMLKILLFQNTPNLIDNSTEDKLTS